MSRSYNTSSGYTAHAPQSGVPSNCTVHDPPLESAGDGLADVVGELTFETPIALAELAAMEHACLWCFETHRVQLVQLFLASDSKRAVLVFRAPDAESVRMACRNAQMPLERVWLCRRLRGRDRP